MSATTIIVAVTLAKALLAILATRQGRSSGPPSPSLTDSDEGEDIDLGFAGRQLADSPTGNLPSEDYSTAAGSRQVSDDFRDPDVR